MEVGVNGGIFPCRIFYIFLLSAVLPRSACIDTFISSIEPSSGGLGGDVKVTIHGSGFSRDQFSFNDDPNVGNFVYLVNPKGSQYPGTVLKESSSQNQIIFLTPRGLMHDDSYLVKVVVDGRLARNRIPSFYPKDKYTPIITDLTPKSGTPGTKVTLQGRIFTDRYSADIATSTNGKRVMFSRIYVGPSLCELYKEESNYSLSLNSRNSDNGKIECKTSKSLIGFFNLSYIVDPPYGRSVAHPPLYHVSYNDKIYLFQQYADITNISHSRGSVAGGLILTIYGNNFGCTQKVFIADTPCEIRAIMEDKYIECQVPAKPAVSGPYFEGDRGVNFEYWTNVTVTDLNSILLKDSSDPGYHFQRIDETSASIMMGTHAGKMTFYFKPPHSGHYKFNIDIYASGGAMLLLDGVSRLTFSSGHRSTKTFDLYLVDNVKYLFQIVYYSRVGHAYIHLKTKHSNTTFTNSMTKIADQEQQRIKVTSQDVDEIQELRFLNLTKQNHVFEVQTVSIQTTPDGLFRFGLYGVYTEPLSVFMTDIEIQDAISAIPIWGSEESVTVEGKYDPTSPLPTYIYTVTFNSTRGYLPNIDVIQVDNEIPVSYTVTKDRPGIPDLDTMVLMLDGIVSKPFSLQLLNEGNISLAPIIMEMFESKCPRKLEGEGSVFYDSFEPYSHDYYYHHHNYHRERSSDAFCGLYVLKNPDMIYVNNVGIPLILYGTVCFAYKGFLQNRIGVHYSYKNEYTSNKGYTKYFYHLFEMDSNEGSDSWYYTCIELYAMVSSDKPGYTDYRLHGLYVNRLNGNVDVYVDSLSLGSRPLTSDPEARLRRKRQANFKKAVVKSVFVSVPTDALTGTYKVRIKPLECGHGFPLFELANACQDSPTDTTILYKPTTERFASSNGNTSTVTSLVSTSTSTTVSSNFSTTSKPSSVESTTSSYFSTTSMEMTTSTSASSRTLNGTLSVTRLSEATLPVSGFIDIAFNGQEKRGLNASLSAAEFKKELETIEGIGMLHVTKIGDCANFDLIIRFLTLAGDLPQMKANFSNLKGTKVSGIIFTEMDGGLNYDPLMGDIVSTVRELPQVRVYVNDVPSSCTGNCSFQWDPTITPEITGVIPQSGSEVKATSIVIFGTGFSTNITYNYVNIGGVECKVTAAGIQNISCNVGNGPLGHHPIIVNVYGKGQATGNITFTYISEITSISPTSGSIGGGQNLTITGYGFDKTVSVTINEKNCEVVFTNYESIVCITPASEQKGIFAVHASHESGSMVTSDNSFKYDLDMTAIVTSVAPITINATGGNLTILGSSFTNEKGYVMVGSELGNVLLWTDNRIELTVHGIKRGWQEIRISAAYGFAVNGTTLHIPRIYVDLEITHLYPLQGSLFGGTSLTIKGSGFGRNVSNINITVGTTNCDAINVTNSKVICQLDVPSITHFVTNKGVDPAFGVYYAFDKPHVTITVGDFIQWTWETPKFVNSVTHSIIEIENPISVRQKEDGFSSGIPVRNGAFRHQFLAKGTYYVWSGFVDIWGIKNYVGTIEVLERRSTVGVLTVRVDKAEAQHVIGGELPTEDDSICKQTVTEIIGCNDEKPSITETNKFSFTFFSCSTPVVNDINVNYGTVNTKIIITGEGFSNEICQNEVRFGSINCYLISATEYSLACLIDRSSQPTIAVLHKLIVRVNNRGFAHINTSSAQKSGFAIIPCVESIFPTRGSLAGGTRLTINGFGFDGSIVIMIGGYNCMTLEHSYSKVICDVPSSNAEEEKSIFVNVYKGEIKIQSICETNCIYTYSSTLTPIMSHIYPEEFSPNIPFNISGTFFSKAIDDFDVQIGNVSAEILDATETYIIAKLNNIPAGNNNIIVRVKDYGKAAGALRVRGSLIVDNLDPISGSLYGNTRITVFGNGFLANETKISVGGSNCIILSTNLSHVTCVTTPHNAGSVNILVSANEMMATYSHFTYSQESTPTVIFVRPSFGHSGDNITISGLNFEGHSTVIFLGNAACEVVSVNTDELKCISGDHPTGKVNVSVIVDNLGISNADVTFEYHLNLSGILPNQGGTAGGQLVTLMGTGMDSSLLAEICDKTCLLHNATPHVYICRTPENYAQVCNVSITLNGLTRMLPDAYLYDESLTPTIANVTPDRGGTGGGTTITIIGEDFGYDINSVSVMIDDVSCLLTFINDKEIHCLTGPHNGSLLTTVNVQRSGNGVAKVASNGDAYFHYIDVWSSPFTWGGGPLPGAGEFVVIPTGTTILLDIRTPILGFLLIQGGHVIFDEKDIELQANYILITDGGCLQIGTDSKPFQHKAFITLYGHFRSKELPIYGAKVLAVRNGTLDLHGAPVPITWTHLSATAPKGTNELHLESPVNWNVGDEIAIASTGGSNTFHENEKKVIQSVSSDRKILILTTVLEADHVSVSEVFDGRLIKMRAEVGLLTRNIVIRGNDDTQWHDEKRIIEAHSNFGRNKSEKCSAMKYGIEYENSQFGATIIISPPIRDSQAAKVHVSNIEITFAGQIFRIGRHPLNFHQNGNMTGSFVHACSIHNSFNRAVNIQGSKYVQIERNVIFDILGGGFVLEDGSEVGVTLFRNLALQVFECHTLTNDDTAPAAFSLANPNNSVHYNAVAGGTHHGYWYRLDYHSQGALYPKSTGSHHITLGAFLDNSAHSLKGYGLYVYENYFPKGKSNIYRDDELAVFSGLTSWNNKMGAAVGNIGAVKFVNFTLIQNRIAGIEIKTISNFVPLCYFTLIQHSLIVGKTTSLTTKGHECTRGGIILPLGRGSRIQNVTFVNFNRSECTAFRWTRIAYVCSTFCGGFTYHLEKIKYINAKNKALYDWEWEGIILDRDGTSTNKFENWTILPTTGTLPSDCEPAPEFSVGTPASICPPKYKWHMFTLSSFRYNRNSHMKYRSLSIKNQYGISSIPYAGHYKGWTGNLLSNTSYKIYFENVSASNNISFSGTFYDLENGDYHYISIDVPKFPDWFSVDGERINASKPISHDNGSHGDWYWHNVKKEITFLVNTRTSELYKTQCTVKDIPVRLYTYKCFYKDCKLPPDPDKTPPAMASPPHDFQYWHDPTIWKLETDGYVTNSAIFGKGVPKDFSHVKILPNTWVKVNLKAICRLRYLLLYGILEFLNSPEVVYKIEAEMIIIKGGRLIIGWPDDPFLGRASIILHRSSLPSPFNPGTGVTLASQCIGVFGGLDLIGKNKGRTWTYLYDTVNPGSSKIVLLEQVKWSVGDEIVITSTAFGPWQSEVFRIRHIDDDQVTVQLNDTLKYKHTVHVEILPNGNKVTLRAGVGLLSRNIKIIGANSDEGTGARVLVGLYIDRDKTISGYAHLSNVEFYHTGEKRFSEFFDPRFSLAYLDVGTVNGIKPSSVNNCSFHSGFGTAVGAIGMRNIRISNNVLYNNIQGILSASVNSTIMNNLVIKTRQIGIEAMRSVNLTLQNNLVTNSENAGYQLPPLDCNETENMYENNKGYSNRNGAVFSTKFSRQSLCYKISGFLIWKSTAFGLLYDGKYNVVFEQNILIENQVGLTASILKHIQISSNKSVIIKNTTFVGQTSSFECGDIVWVRSNGLIGPSVVGSDWYYPDGMAGMLFPKYYSIDGLTKVENVTFSRYSDSICLKNYAIITNLGGNEFQRPIYSERVILKDVHHTNKIFFQRPVRTSFYHCFSMDCEVFRLAVLKDLDGTFLGHDGAAIPNSEYEDIDYENKVPNEMITSINGSRIPLKEIATYKGVVRSKNCTYQRRWQAFECLNDINYAMLLIENIDENAKYRQISPVALLSDGYLDLLDVPLDNGNCFHYVCRRKLTLFNALIALGKSYLLHFTRTTPRNLRFKLLNVSPNEGIALTIWHSRPNRLDVFVKGEYVISTNARINDNGRYIISMPKGDEFKPDLKNRSGTNFFDRTRGEITVIVKGEEMVEVVSQDTIIVSFGIPALTNIEFFAENIVENLAAFLDIPLTKVCIVNIVRESGSKRKKRSENGANIVIEIGNEPTSEIYAKLQDYVVYSTLAELVSLIVNECQLGNISNILKGYVVCDKIEFPADDLDMASTVYSGQAPSHLYFYDEPEPEYEGVLLKTQPKIRAIDIDGLNVTGLGTLAYPWQLKVEIKNGSGHNWAFLGGTTIINCSHGWFNFTDLSISHSGQDYVLYFNVVYPQEAEHFSLESKPFNVTKRPMKIHIYNQTTDDIFAFDEFAVTIDLADLNTDDVITNVTWRDHDWICEVNMVTSSEYANLSGVINTTFDVDTGLATFNNLSMSGFGLYYLQIKVISDPPEYNLSFNWMVTIRDPTTVNKTVTETSSVKLKFDAVFNEVLTTTDEVDAFVQTLLTEYHHIYQDIYIVEGKAYDGSIIVEFVIAGSEDDIQSTVDRLCEDVNNGTEFVYKNHSLVMASFLSVDNKIYGEHCSGTTSSKDFWSKLLSSWIFVVIVSVTSLIVLVLLVSCVIYKCHNSNKFTKVQDIRPRRQRKDEPMYIEDIHEDRQEPKRELSGFSLKME